MLRAILRGFLVLPLIAAITHIALAQSTNLVVNPGFEAGLIGWTIGGQGDGVHNWLIATASDPKHSGNGAARDGCVGAACISVPTSYLYQDLPTVIGQSYLLSFWGASNNGINNNFPNELQVLLGGKIVLDLYDSIPGDSVYREYVAAPFTATSTTTRLQFNGRQDPGHLLIDDVSVTAATARVPLGNGTLTVTGAAGSNTNTAPSYIQNSNSFAFKLTDGINTVSGQERNNANSSGGPNTALQAMTTFDGRHAAITGTITALSFNDADASSGGSQIFAIGFVTSGVLQHAAITDNSYLAYTLTSAGASASAGLDGFDGILLGYYVDTAAHLYLASHDLYAGNGPEVKADLTQLGYASGQSLTGQVSFTIAFDGSNMAISVNGAALGSIPFTHDLSNCALVVMGNSLDAGNGAGMLAYSNIAVSTPSAVGPPSLVYAASGDNQTGTAGTALALPVVVGVVDAYRNPVAGTSVNFTASNATVAAASAQTDATGRATAQVMLGSAAGPATVTATVNGIPPVTFHLTATANPLLPAISTIVSASGFGGFPAVAPGSWVEIYGSNLAPDTRQWAGSDFNGNNAPTSLDGVQVRIGGQNAFIDYISSSPGQINAQLPSNIATGGPLAVTVTNANGTSPAFNITVNATEPGLLAPGSFLVGGKQYAVALLPDGATYILPSGAISGLSSRPAQPGETITLYGIGFGPVSPNIPAGQIVGQNNQLSNSFQVLFGQTAAQIVYAGLAPGFVGLYQFDVVVPAIPDSDSVPLTFNLGGVAGTQTLYTSVHE